MWKPCLVCSVYHLEMINIYQHPGKLAYILKFLLRIQAKQDDYLCKVCCDQVINAYESKQKYKKSKLHEPKVLSDGDNAVSVELNFVGQIEISSSESEEDTEPKSDEGNLVSQIEILSEDGGESKSDELLEEDYCEIFVVDDENVSKFCEKWLSDHKLQLKKDLEYKSSPTDGLEVLRDIKGTANESFSASQREAASPKVSEGGHEPKRGVEEDFNVVSLHADSRQSDSKRNTEIFCKSYKREKSVDIDGNNEFFEGGETNDVDVARTQQQDCVIVCDICNKTWGSITSYKDHITEKHPSRKTLVDSPIKEKPSCNERSFNSKYNLRKRGRRKHDTRKHHAQHTAEKPYKCSYCSKTFPSSYHQKRHVSTHLKKKRHKCTDCGIYFATKSSLKSHKITHTAGRSLKCSHCSMAFTSRFELSSHLQTHIQEEKEKPCEPVCPDCGKGFSTSSGLRKHLLTHTRPEDPRKYDHRKRDTKKNTRKQHTAAKPYNCHYCSQTFRDTYDQKRHLSTHLKEKRYKCSVCRIYFSTENSLKSHQITHTAGRSRFELSSHLQTHIQEEKEKPCETVCPDCGKGFSTSSGLRKHTRKQHTAAKPYNCHYCSQTFRDTYDQKRHVSSHLKKKRYKCCDCRIYFSTESSFTSHKIAYTAKGSFKCSHCSVSFKCRFQLSRHLQTHIHEAKDKPCEFLCPECGKGFPTSSGVRNHILRHTRPYVCCECGKAFGNLANLKIHHMEHTGERPFECHLCSKAFKTNYSLCRHHLQVHTDTGPACVCSLCWKHFDDPRYLLVHQLHSHTEKRPYECPYCPKLFRSQSGLCDHLAKHMGELTDWCQVPNSKLPFSTRAYKI